MTDFDVVGTCPECGEPIYHLPHGPEDLYNHGHIETGSKFVWALRSDDMPLDEAISKLKEYVHA